MYGIYGNKESLLNIFVLNYHMYSIINKIWSVQYVIIVHDGALNNGEGMNFEWRIYLQTYNKPVINIFHPPGSVAIILGMF